MRKVGNRFVSRTKMIGCNWVKFAAWEVSTMTGKHRTITSGPGDTWLGMVGSEVLPAELDALPALTDERSNAVRAYHAERYRDAYATICEAYPEAKLGRPDMAEISLEW